MQANYDVDLWGSRSSIDAARASLAAQQAAAAAAELTIATSVASGYMSLPALDEQLRVTRATLATRENSLNLAQRQFEAGYTSRLEWMQAASEYQAAKAQIPQRASDPPAGERAEHSGRHESAPYRAPDALRAGDAAADAVAAAFAAVAATTGYCAGATPAAGGGQLARLVAGEAAAVAESDRFRHVANLGAASAGGQSFPSVERRRQRAGAAAEPRSANGAGRRLDGDAQSGALCL